VILTPELLKSDPGRLIAKKELVKADIMVLGTYYSSLKREETDHAVLDSDWSTAEFSSETFLYPDC